MADKGFWVLEGSAHIGSGGDMRTGMVRHRVRIRFCKQGDLRWIGHLDLMRCLERVFRRAGLPLAFSEGFHPKPRISFPLPLALGIAGSHELLEVELTEPLSASEIRSRLEPYCLPGLCFSAVDVLPSGAAKARPRSVEYRIAVPPALQPGTNERIAALMSSERCLVTRPGRAGQLDIRPQLITLELAGGQLQMRLGVGAGPGVGPRDVLSALGLELEQLRQHGAVLERTAVEL
jgi:radical SAM-linked protein